MKFRRIMAIMMTVLMLISMMPTTMAEACNHINTEWRWPNGKPAHCLDWKMADLILLQMTAAYSTRQVLTM